MATHPDRVQHGTGYAPAVPEPDPSGNGAEPARPDGRRARGASTRAAVLAAATTLFAQKGYAATSLAAIAAASGTRTASIHHAFGSKEGLLAAVMQTVGDAMFDMIDAVNADSSISPQDRVKSAMQALVEQPQFLRLFLLLTLERRDGDPAILRIVENIRSRGRRSVARGIEDLLIDIPPEHRAHILEDFGRLTLIMLDGVFLSQQIEGEAIHGARTYDLATVALEGALIQMISQATGHPDASQ